MIHVNEDYITPFLYRFLRRRRTGFEARSLCKSTNMTLALNTERKIFSEKKRLSKAFFWSKDDFEKSTEKSCEMLFDDVHVDFFGDSSSDPATEGSGNFMELPRTCVENQFVCFYRLDAILIPKLQGSKTLRLSDAYRYCESQKMTLFQPDTKAKNLFLSKLAILVDKPILFDLYRFGTNFEFKYGLVSNIIH
ncbi:Oidioi.mRNA.OKI2018_I69.PAR.g9450.t1.cds [Oikopleura dioica]|uniref:Oidioi.mRNA.OKI2018_I69.PAR.g9450.t1.cds n=1 Tax=Oikopleura dioica TaxID=34765 RepID=A0ABN7RP53_OIKDI|nr:Oidioi.mRNA.OKI2018_I69.PAR.g9450.t1.cds [Oikopleura dioica]